MLRGNQLVTRKDNGYRAPFLEVPLSMIRKSGYRFSLATNAERVCAEIMLKSKR